MGLKLDRESLLKNEGGVWRPVLVAAGFGPLGFLFWGWLFPASGKKEKPFTVALILLWFFQLLFCFYMLYQADWQWYNNIIFSNLFAVVWLLALLFYSSRSPGGINVYILPFALNILVLESWIVLLSRLLSPNGPRDSGIDIVFAAILGFSWIFSLRFAIVNSPGKFRHKPSLVLAIGWVMAIGSLIIAVMLHYFTKFLLHGIAGP